jgi:hypothetical protein
MVPQHPSLGLRFLGAVANGSGKATGKDGFLAASSTSSASCSPLRQSAAAPIKPVEAAPICELRHLLLTLLAAVSVEGFEERREGAESLFARARFLRRPSKVCSSIVARR